MGIYEAIQQVNQHNKQHLAVAMIKDNGEVISYTYEKLFRAAEDFTKQMALQGILPKDRIVIVGENSPQWQMAFLAVMQLGSTAVLVDASLAESEILKLIHQSDCRGVVTSTHLLKEMPQLRTLEVPVFDMLACKY